MCKSDLNLMDYNDINLITTLFLIDKSIPEYNIKKLKKGKKYNICLGIYHGNFKRQAEYTREIFKIPKNTFVFVLDTEIITGFDDDKKEITFETECYYYLGTCKTQSKLIENIELKPIILKKNKKK